VRVHTGELFTGATFEGRSPSEALRAALAMLVERARIRASL
jgi:hypothetical protein